MPVPSGIVARSTSRPAIPFTTSFSVPSPPTATTSVAPPSTAPRARSIRWPGRSRPSGGPRASSIRGRGLSEKSVSPVRPRRAARCASSGQRLPVAPLSDAGLTRKTVLLVGDSDVEGDLRHAVDGRPQLVVGDALELALDDDVADGQEATRLDAAD